MKDYYAIKIQKNNKVHFVIWYTDDIDGILIENEKIKSFLNFDDLKDYCSKNKIDIKKDITTYNLDKASKWISSSEQNVNCKAVLDLWNLMSDLAKSVNAYFYGDDDEMLDISEKLFYGNNIPAINRSDIMYHPKWTNDEYMDIKKVIESGMNLFNKYLEG